MDIISELKNSNLVGLGGAGFPTWKKWQAVKEAKNPRRFLICNLTEGEPGVFKDEYILQNHLSDLISGIVLATETISAQKSFIYLNDNYKKYIRRIQPQIKGKKIEIFLDTGGYITGEETTLLQVIEGKLRQPRSRPPYPTEVGLFGFPTLINNAETFYRAWQIANGNYQNKRFYSISGKNIARRIIEQKVDANVSDVLPEWLIKRAKFVQVGGISGCFLPKDKFSEIVSGTGAIRIFENLSDIFSAFYESVSFLKSESCGKCAPCREGSYRVVEKIIDLKKSENLWEKEEILSLIDDIAENAKESSFCGLGKSIALPIESVIKNFKSELIK